MKKIDALTEDFRFQYEKFLIGCDSQEEIEHWDKEENGEMEAFYENDLLCVILRLIAADGRISEKEAEYLNRYFGLEYTAEELENICADFEDLSAEEFEAQFAQDLDALRAASGKLADAYKELVGLACDIIIASDEQIAPEEAEEAERLKALL
ncbi:MAG: TerB family tellurite resistance protein [Lachnospiraceae bacterium]|nr:TerB family tellurite resistance protein [Lachnospiraceae bacterium]